MDNTFTDLLPAIISNFEQQGLVTRTFRRLDLPRQLSIIDAILEESAFNGPAEMNIKKVAARARVSIGSLYQYFNNKQGLLDFATALTVQQTITTFNEFLPYLDQLTFQEAYQIYLSYGLEWGNKEKQFVRMFVTAVYLEDERHQKKGIGRILFSKAVNHLLNLGCKEILLDAVPNVVRLYEKFRFKKVERSFRLKLPTSILNKSLISSPRNADLINLLNNWKEGKYSITDWNGEGCELVT
mgnify:CR=1 FL=1